jgi:hypothetical protein
MQMKSAFLTRIAVIVIAISTMSLAANAQKTTAKAAAPDYTTSKNNVVSINPVSLIYGSINVSLEHKMGTKNSISVNAGYWSRNEWWAAFNVGASYKWYFDAFEENKSALNGLAVGPRIDFEYWQTSRDWAWLGLSEYDDYPSLRIGAEVSYKWVFGDGKWAVEPNFKLTIPIIKKDYGFTLQSYGYGVNVGYCF